MWDVYKQLASKILYVSNFRTCLLALRHESLKGNLQMPNCVDTFDIVNKLLSLTCFLLILSKIILS